MAFNPPQKILRTSDGIEMKLQKVKPKKEGLLVDLFVYEYINGMRIGATVDITETEITKQLKNYWRVI